MKTLLLKSPKPQAPNSKPKGFFLGIWKLGFGIWFFLSFFILYSSFVMAQSWERTYGDTAEGYSVVQTNDGGFISVGEQWFFNGNADIYLVKTNSVGDMILEKNLGDTNIHESGRSIDKTFDTGFIIAGFNNLNNNISLLKLDSNCNTLWSKNIGNYQSNPKSIIQTSDSGFIITAQIKIGSDYYVYVLKTNSVGDTLWTKTFGGGFDNVGNVKEIVGVGYIIVANELDTTNNWNALLIKTDMSGNAIWIKSFSDFWICSVDITNDGGFVFTGSWSTDIKIVKTDSSGNILWQKNYGDGVSYYQSSAIEELNGGGFIVTGHCTIISTIYLYFMKTDSAGNIICERFFGDSLGFAYGYDIKETYDKGYIITGVKNDTTIENNALYLIKLDSLCYTISTNTIEGSIFHDNNSNCTNDSSEIDLQNILIKVSPVNKFATTDNNGNYSILVDTGSYTVQSIPPNNYWQQTCPNPPTYTVNFTSFYDTSSANDFGYEIAVYCPLMFVDISTWALRPCMQSTYTVHYCNNGTITADSAYIDIAFDNDITPVSSTLNWSSQNGNIYSFNIGNIAPQQCGNFYITANVSCSATVGSTHCIEAHIFPDSICTPIDSTWDKSSVSVEGICVNDSLACFTIYNTGDDMQGASQYRIYENNTLVDTGTFQLNAGDSIVICHAAEGLTIRLEADQRPGHPGNSHPNANVEMCGGIPPAQTGFITQVPEDDADEFIEMDCREITASLDPNEKLVKPAGISQNHFIDSLDILEYQINFQNTGTDTAFKIVVRDTLTQNLDITTVQSGAGSHPYSFRIYGQGILEWTFNNILLPDSNTNETLSHGFVRFKATQKTGNTIGTIIENSASIYFDYNAPVITNTAFNTVWKEAALSTPKIYEENIGIFVYPNPFTETTTIVIASEARNLSLKIYNLLGEEIRNIRLPSCVFQLERGNLPAGIYIYKVFSNENLIGAGKLVAE